MYRVIWSFIKFRGNIVVRVIIIRVGALYTQVSHICWHHIASMSYILLDGPWFFFLHLTTLNKEWSISDWCMWEVSWVDCVNVSDFRVPTAVRHGFNTCRWYLNEELWMLPFLSSEDLVQVLQCYPCNKKFRTKTYPKNILGSSAHDISQMPNLLLSASKLALQVDKGMAICIKFQHLN